MQGPTFFPVNVCHNVGREWRASNRALHRLIQHHRSNLEAAEHAAGRIRSPLQSLFPVLDQLCMATCPWCPEPCCIVNKVWFDFQDLLFFHLIGERLPPAQLASERRETCRYLAHRGCVLPRIIRPWACTMYVCGTQMRKLRRADEGVRERLQLTVQDIRIARLTMEEAFVNALNRQRLNNR